MDNYDVTSAVDAERRERGFLDQGTQCSLKELIVIFQLANSSFEVRPDSSREISLTPREREREKERERERERESFVKHFTWQKKRNTKHYLMKSFIT